MEELIEHFTLQLQDALHIGETAVISQGTKDIHHVVVTGMGGSGIGGDIVKSLLFNKIKKPFLVIKNYEIPAFVDEHTLLIASSFSGNTEETLSCIQNAIQKRAQVVVVTSGGKLLEVAKAHDIDYIRIPGESQCPRANIGYSVIQLLFILHKRHLIADDFTEDLKKAVRLLNEEKDNIKTQAYRIAENINGLLPIIYTGTALAPVGLRFQQQLNENAKHFCHANVFPEMNHNELVGWNFPGSFFDKAVVIFLRSSFDHQRINARMDICKDIFTKKAKDVIEIQAKGDTFIIQCFYLIHLTDWISFFLAKQNSVDPLPVEVIAYLKSQLMKIG